MKNSFNKYLYFFGLGIFVCFVVYVIANNASQQTQYILLVYEVPANSENQIEGLEDPRNLIRVYSFGFLDVPDKRIIVTSTPLYVLMKQKNHEIEFITDKIEKLNAYLSEL